MKNDQTKYFATFVDRKPLQKYNEIVGFAVMAEWQTRQLEGLVGVSPVEVRVFLAALIYQCFRGFSTSL